MKKSDDGLVYRQKTGSILKKKRLNKGYTIADIVTMTGVSRSSIINIENGSVTNIDFIIEYAKAVKYPLETLKDFGIKLEPLHVLDLTNKTNLTSKIRKYIIDSDFLKKGNEVAEIREELLRKKLIDESVGSTAIAGVMRNLLNDEVVKAKKSGRKNLYYK